jgi:hypothetical protein
MQSTKAYYAQMTIANVLLSINDLCQELRKNPLHRIYPTILSRCPTFLHDPTKLEFQIKLNDVCIKKLLATVFFASDRTRGSNGTKRVGSRDPDCSAAYRPYLSYVRFWDSYTNSSEMRSLDILQIISKKES